MPSSSKASVLLDASRASAVSAWTLGEIGSRSRHHDAVGGTNGLVSRQPDPAEQDRINLEQRLQEAYEAGREEGRTEGEIAEGLRLRNAVSAAEAALDELRGNESRWQESVEANIAALAVAVARYIIGRELQATPETVADLVKRALAEFPIDQPLRIRVHPMDLSVLSMHATPSGEPIAIAPNRDVRWLADARIQPGGCVVEGRERIVDGRIDTALERVYRRMSDTNV